jgi:hypothetical protein
MDAVGNQETSPPTTRTPRSGKRTLSLFLLSMLASAVVILAVGWFTGFRELARGAVVSVAVFALLPVAIIAAGVALALLLLMFSLVAGILSDGGGDFVGGAGEDVIIESGVRMIPGYYRWLASRRHPVFWGVPLGVMLGGLALSGLLAVAVIPQEGNTAQSLVQVQEEIERVYLEKGRYPTPTEAGHLTWESLGRPQRGLFVLDGFARPVEYQVAGVWKAASYRVRSFGYDGRPGGGDDLCVAGATKLGRLGAKLKLDRDQGGKWSVKAKLAGIAEMRCEGEK